MKFATFSKSIVLSLSLILAWSAFAATKDTFQIGNPVTVNGTVLKPGEYIVQWDGNGPNVVLSILQGKKEMAKGMARLVELTAPAGKNEAIERENTGEANTLTGIRFQGKTAALELEAEAAGTTGVLLVANQGDADLGIVDPNSAQQVARIVEGGTTGHEVAVSLDGKTAYVPIYGDSSVGEAGTDGRDMVAIDIASRKVVGHLDFGHGVRPHCAVMNPKDGLLYVTTELDQTVTIIDPKTLQVVGVIPTGQEQSHMLVISHDGRFGYTANVSAGTVSVLDVPGRKLLSVIPVSTKVQRISISADDKRVFTADQAKPQLAVIDTTTNKVKTWIPIAAPGYGTASSLDGRWLLVCVPDASQVSVVDLKTLQVVRTVAVPRVPHEIVISPDDKTAYVSCIRTKKIAAINLSDWSIKSLIDAGESVDGMAWAAGTR
jgi:YVTN family beta-propeller protein